jgi:hypothetical protein
MEHHKPLKWFRDHSRLTCEGCGYEIALHNEQLCAAINELHTVMSKLRRGSIKERFGAEIWGDRRDLPGADLRTNTWQSLT